MSEEVVSEEKININTATKEELIQLKGIGESLAQRVIEYREQNGPFDKLEDILKVKGLGKDFLKKNHDRITVGVEVIEKVMPETKPEEKN